MSHDKTYDEMIREMRSKKATTARMAGLAQGKMDQLGPTSRIGRNDKCPCNSGKKWKHCHGNLRKVAQEYADGRIS